jgi:drug/metabolite transporter (DMT)-like permease
METKSQTMATHFEKLKAGQADQRADKAGTRSFLSGCALLGTIGVFVHYAHASPLTATWFRCAFGLLGLTLWLLLRRQTGLLRPTMKTGPWIMSAAALMVIAWALFFNAIERMSAGVAIVLFHFQPMWVLILGSMWLREPVGRQRILAVAAAMFGLVLATGILEHTSLLGQAEAQRPGYWIGVVSCLLGAFCTACVTIIARKLRGIPSGILAWWQCAIGFAVLWIWPMKEGWPESGISLIWLAGLGLIHTGLAYTLLYSGMGRLPTGRIAVLQFAYPAVAIAIDRVVFDQRLSTYQLVGIAVMAASIWLAERGPKV